MVSPPMSVSDHPIARRVASEADLAFDLLLVAFFGGQLVMSFQYRPNNRLFPLIIDVIALAFLGYLLLNRLDAVRGLLDRIEWLAPDDQSMVGSDEREPLDVERTAVMFGWALAYLVLIIILDYLLVTIAFMALFFRRYVFDSWRRSVGLSLAIAVPIWLLIVFVLRGVGM